MMQLKFYPKLNSSHDLVVCPPNKRIAIAGGNHICFKTIRERRKNDGNKKV